VELEEVGVVDAAWPRPLHRAIMSLAIDIVVMLVAGGIAYGLMTGWPEDVVQTQWTTVGERDEDGAYREVARFVVVREQRTGWWPDAATRLPGSTWIGGRVPPPSEVRWERPVGTPRMRAATPSTPWVAPTPQRIRALADDWETVDEAQVKAAVPRAIDLIRANEARDLATLSRLSGGSPTDRQLDVAFHPAPSMFASTEWDVTAFRFDFGPADVGTTAILSIIVFDVFNAKQPGLLVRFMGPQLVGMAIVIWCTWRLMLRLQRERPVPRSEVDLPGWPGHRAEPPVS
jgi:hypothetical protein